MNYKYSIAIPAYKNQYLRECIDSVLSQTYTNFELIILNDCSPYDLKSIIDEFSDDRIMYFENEQNVGAVELVNNWNSCLERASGQYFVCIGDDDVLDIDFLKEIDTYTEQYPQQDIFHLQTMIIDENSEPIKMQDYRPLRESSYSMVYHRLFHHRVQFVGDFMYKTDALKVIGGYVFIPLAWGSDDVTAYEVAKKNGVINIPRTIFYYRQNRYTISKSINPLIKNKAINEEFNWINTFLNESKAELDSDKVMIQYLKENINSLFSKKRIYNISDSLSPFALVSFAELLWQSLKKNLILSEVCKGYVLSYKKIFK